jgi:hypothetical protein
VAEHSTRVDGAREEGVGDVGQAGVGRGTLLDGVRNPFIRVFGDYEAAAAATSATATAELMYCASGVAFAGVQVVAVYSSSQSLGPRYLVMVGNVDAPRPGPRGP